MNLYICAPAIHSLSADSNLKALPKINGIVLLDYNWLNLQWLNLAWFSFTYIYSNKRLFWAQTALASLELFQGPKKSLFLWPNPSNGPCNRFARIKNINS